MAGERQPPDSALPHATRVCPRATTFPAKKCLARSQERSRRLGSELFTLFFPEELTASNVEVQRAAMEKLSAYEQERNRQVRHAGSLYECAACF